MIGMIYIRDSLLIYIHEMSLKTEMCRTYKRPLSSDNIQSTESEAKYTLDIYGEIRVCT